MEYLDKLCPEITPDHGVDDKVNRGVHDEGKVCYGFNSIIPTPCPEYTTKLGEYLKIGHHTGNMANEKDENDSKQNLC